MGFAYLVSEYRPARHLIELSSRLVDIAAGRLDRLIVNMPPGHGKSELGSIHFPAWYLGHWPDRRVIVAAHTADLARRFGRRTRDILDEHGPEFFGVRVSEDSAAAGRWEIQKRRGSLIATGVGGPITGERADLIIVDDPIKNAMEATSVVYREKLKEWYKTTLRTRLQPRGAIVIIMTRWHEDDLCGWLLKRQEEGGRRWDLLNLPALAEG